MHMTGEERFLIGLQMFESARTIVLSSLPENVTAVEKRRYLCERFYGDLASEIFPDVEMNGEISQA